jgi:predicted ester cyclase
MMPRYSADGEVCQIVVERQHYFSGIAHLDSTMPHELVAQIIDELAPSGERGPLTTDKEMARLSTYGGNSATSFSDYENVSIDISRLTSSPDDVVALIKWKHQQCM